MSAASVQITNAAVSTAPPRWKTLYFNIRDFRNLPTTRNHYVKTLDFSCNGHDWCLDIYPGGRDDAFEGNVSIFLNHRSEGAIEIDYELVILDKFGKRRETMKEFSHSFEGMDEGFGCSGFMKRSVILDESNNILYSVGTLTVAVSIKEEPSDVFVPKNPLHKMMQGIFLDEATRRLWLKTWSSYMAERVTLADSRQGPRWELVDGLVRAFVRFVYAPVDGLVVPQRR